MRLCHGGRCRAIREAHRRAPPFERKVEVFKAAARIYFRRLVVSFHADILYLPPISLLMRQILYLYATCAARLLNTAIQLERATPIQHIFVAQKVELDVPCFIDAARNINYFQVESRHAMPP